MPKHKLYFESFENSQLNYDMEDADAEENANIPLTAEGLLTVKEDIKDENEEDGCEIFQFENTETAPDEEEKFNFSNFLERRPYSYEEDVEILKFVLHDQNIFRVSSILLWKYLEVKKKNPKRSYQSLKNRFLRNIKPKIFSKYRHLIKNEEQARKIIEKFPDLKIEAFTKQPPQLELKRKNNRTMEPKTGTVIKLPTTEPIPLTKTGTVKKLKATEHISLTQTTTAKKKTTEPFSLTQTETAKKLKTTDPIPLTKTGKGKKLQTTDPVTLPQIESGTTGSEKSGTRKVILEDNSVKVIFSSLPTHATSSNANIGIYDRYLRCKEKNKLTVCPTCGLLRGSKQDVELDSEDENDIIISCSFKTKSPEFSQGSTGSKNKINSSEVAEASAKVVKDSLSWKGQSQNDSVCIISSSPSLLNCVESPDLKQIEMETDKPESKNFESGKIKSTSSNERAYATQEEKPSGDLTDGELESLYSESLKKCERLISSEEEEVLVKKCFKKNRKAFGFDSCVLLHKANLDSFFVKSQSPPLDSLLADQVDAPEVGETSKSPLVENMKKMFR